MKIWPILLLLLLIGFTYGETYQLGNYEISFNLSAPANFVLETPIHQITTVDAWMYGLNITPSSGGWIKISTEESSQPIRQEGLQNMAAMRRVELMNLGIE